MTEQDQSVEHRTSSRLAAVLNTLKGVESVSGLIGRRRGGGDERPRDDAIVSNDQQIQKTWTRERKIIQATDSNIKSLIS